MYTHLFEGNVYSLSVLFSGIVYITGALGGLFPFFFVAYVCVCLGLFYLLVQPDESCRDEFVRERPRLILCDPSCQSQWVKLNKDQLNLANECVGSIRTARMVGFDARKSAFCALAAPPCHKNRAAASAAMHIRENDPRDTV